MVTFGGLRALDGVSLTAEPGTIVGLIGPNGSGKTTLLDAVSGLVPLGRRDRPPRRRRPGRLPARGAHRARHGPLVPGLRASSPTLTVEDTLLLTEDARHPVGVAVAPRCSCRGRAGASATSGAPSTRSSASLGLERFRHHRISHLSTGTRRVVDLASVVLARPRLLLLDEPTAGIAQREAEAFIPLLRQLHEVTGSTIVLVEHDVPLVFALCSHVVVMATGRVVAAGTPDEVSRDPDAPGRLPRGQRGGPARVGCRHQPEPAGRREAMRPWSTDIRTARTSHET